MTALITVAQEIHRADWQWARSWWESKAKQLHLIHQESKGGRVTYKDVNGLIWDAYLAGEKLLMLKVTIEVFEDVVSLSDSEYEDKVDEYTDKFEAAAKNLESALGKPVFCDGAAASGFPNDQDANWLALWPGNNARVMLQQKHEGRDLPFRLCLVVAP